jgi:glycosyltransferase involved in cell wall biosynthesis
MAKILHVIPDATVNYGGPASAMSNIMSLLQSMGHAVEALSVAGPAQLMPMPGSCHRFPSSFPSRFRNSRAATSWFSDCCWQFDLVWFHSVWSGINIRLARVLRKNKRRYIVVPHGSLDPFDLRKKAVAKKFLGPLLIRSYLQNSAAVICSAQRESDCLVTYGARCNVTTLPWPVPSHSARHQRVEARKHLGLNNSEFVVLSLGRIDPVKGFPILLQAIQMLAQSGIRTRLLIAGPDSRGYSAVVRQMVEKLNLGKIVTFLLPVVGDEKKKLMQAADTFALPSLHENFGMAIIEAMQQGLPCVISNNVYISDKLERGGAALVCNYDAGEVFAALQDLATNPVLRLKMSAAAFQIAKTFAPAVLKDLYGAKLNEILGSP